MKSTSHVPSIAQRIVETPFLLLVGGLGYYCIELVYRGYSHWSMMICGALTFLAIYRINERFPDTALVLRALLGASVITAVEFLAGCIVNLMLGLNVWDYSELPYNLLGQICLPFSLLWFLLCLPVCGLCILLRRAVFPSDEATD